MFRLFGHCIIAILHGILLKTLYYSINYFMDYYNFHSEIVLTLIPIILWSLYIVYVFVCNQREYQREYEYNYDATKPEEREFIDRKLKKNAYILLLKCYLTVVISFFPLKFIYQYIAIKTST